MSTPYGQTPGPAPRKRLTRSATDRMIAGVCGGFAQYFNVDSVLVRLLFVLLVLAGVVPGVLAYILAWIIMPAEF